MSRGEVKLRCVIMSLWYFLSRNLIKSLIEGIGGEIEKVDKWGKRRFAYEINDNTEGFYVVIDFKAESGATSEVERILKITDEVVRYLLVRKDQE